jgi:formylglycine-generating enzyme required for sulfatase activity
MTTQEKELMSAKHLAHYPLLKAYVESLRSIPGGTFQMGSTTGVLDDRLVQTVTLSAFRIGATPVTAATWNEYCAATGNTLPDALSLDLLDHPVVNVSWNDIMGVNGNGGFCAWASEIAGFRLTLPTEAQFEYASRGGQDGLEFPWGDVFDDSKLWCSKPTDRKSTAPVIRPSNIFRNGYGLTDMVGNVWDWCFDLYAPYTSASETDPIGPNSSSDTRRCVRGGSWYYDDPDFFRCADRNGYFPDDCYVLNGFRLSAGSKSEDSS